MMDNKISKAITSNGEYNSDKYHKSTPNDKIRDNYFHFMTKVKLMEYFNEAIPVGSDIRKTIGIFAKS